MVLQRDIDIHILHVFSKRSCDLFRSAFAQILINKFVEFIPILINFDRKKPALDISPGEITSFSTFDRSSATTSRVDPIKRVHPSNNNNDSTSGGNSVRFPPFSPYISPSPPPKKKWRWREIVKGGGEISSPLEFNEGQR